MALRTLIALTIGLFLIVGEAAAAQGAEEPYDDAMTYAQERGWMTPFSDGSLKPDKTLTRVELLKVVLLAAGHGDEAKRCSARSTARLADVPSDAWYAPYVCAGLRFDLLTPPTDGLIHPGRAVTLSEAAKMVTVAMLDETPAASDPWYTPYIKALAKKRAIPPELAHYRSFVTRGELAEILRRLTEDDTNQASVQADDVLAGRCTWFEEQGIPGVNLYEVKRAWLGWYNDARSAQGLEPLRYNKQLTRTAGLWSQQAAGAGSITHKRTGQTLYYDYPLITSWFEAKGVTFANINRTTFSENIGWGVFTCPKNADCTQTFISAVRTTFDFYMSEKGKASSPHYDSIMNPNYRELGLGIATSGNRYYLTAHYGTKITSDPAPVCP